MNLVMIGAGGHGRVVLDIIREQGLHQVTAVVDADPLLTGKQLDGIDIIGQANLLPRLKSRDISGAIIAIGDNRIRQRYLNEVRAAGLKLVSAIHPKASVARSCTIGEGVVVCAHATLCVEARISDGAIINTAAVVDHECEIGQASHVCPGALLAGRVRLGERVFVGLGAKIIQCLDIGDDVMIAAGAVAVCNIPASVRVAGVPAKLMKR
jgi:UDP-perosamine 4-acetyltransferase